MVQLTKWTSTVQCYCMDMVCYGSAVWYAKNKMDSNGAVWDGAIQYIMVWYGIECSSMVQLTKMDPQMELYGTVL